MVRLGNNEVLKTFTKTLTFVNANADPGCSTIALSERCSGELKIDIQPLTLMSPFYIKTVICYSQDKKNKNKTKQKQKTKTKNKKTKTHASGTTLLKFANVVKLLSVCVEAHFP